MKTSIVFINTRSTPIHLYWPDYSGECDSFGVIPPDGGRRNMPSTYLTHPWVITDDTTSEVLGIWNPVEQP